MGHWRGNPEQCLLASRGKPHRLNADVPELILAPRREHSRKPDEIYGGIERLMGPDGQFLELFASTQAPTQAPTGHAGSARTGRLDGAGKPTATPMHRRSPMTRCSEPELPPLGELLSMTVRTAMRVTGFSKDCIYDLLAAGEIKSFLMGSRRFIDAVSLRDYIARRAAEPLTIRRSPQPRHGPGGRKSPK